MIDTHADVGASISMSDRLGFKRMIAMEENIKKAQIEDGLDVAECEVSHELKNQFMKPGHPTKSQINHKLRTFVSNCFKAYGKNDDNEDDVLTRQQVGQILYMLMKGHNYHEAWSDDEFNEMFDMYQEDEDDAGADEDIEDKSEPKAQGLDRNEFTKMIKRCSQL